MSSSDHAVRTISQLEPEDFRIMMIVEIGMIHHRYVPQNEISRLTGMATKRLDYRFDRLEKFNLIHHRIVPYLGYALNQAGYDCLALNALVKADVLDSLGKPLGIGKESDVYDALSPNGERLAVKMYHLGRTSFHQTRRLRGYISDRRHISWFYQSRLAAEKEFLALKELNLHGVAVPKALIQNRHVVVMNFIEGVELYRSPNIPNPSELLDEIMLNVKLSFRDAGIIHADLSEFNVMVQPNYHITIIDWPQYVRKTHPNAGPIMKRDLENIFKFFKRRFGIEQNLIESLVSLGIE